MIVLTEQQRLDAIKACDGIEAANAKLQQACKNILEILERSSKRCATGEANERIVPSTGDLK